MIDEETDLIQFIQDHQDDFYRFCYSYVKDSTMLWILSKMPL